MNHFSIQSIDGEPQQKSHLVCYRCRGFRWTLHFTNTYLIDINNPYIMFMSNKCEITWTKAMINIYEDNLRFQIIYEHVLG